MCAVGDVEAALAAARAGNASMIRDNAKAGSSCAGEWKRFTKFVDEHELLDTDSRNRYLTRQNVDLYFSVEVVRRRGTQNTMRRIASASKWHSKHVEHIGEGFELESAVTHEALLSQKSHSETTGGATKLGADPHKGLKDNTPVQERINSMKCMYGSRPSDWQSCTVNFAWGMNGAIRGASNRKLTRRIVSALKWHAKHVECIGQSFDIESEVTSEALLTQKRCTEKSGGAVRPGADPHKGLKDNIPVQERMQLMK